MINIVLPIGGKATRFVEEGYMAPKPLIMVQDKHMIDWAMDSIDIKNCRLIFVVRKDHVNSHSIDKILFDKFNNGSTMVDVIVENPNPNGRGALWGCMAAKDLINNNDPLFVYTPDVFFQPKFEPSVVVNSNVDGYLLCFKANNPAHSYVQLDSKYKVIKTAEKEVISENAAVGLYYFKRGSTFLKYAQEMIDKNITVNNEFYICPMYNLMIRDDSTITISHVDKMHVLGTAKDLRFFTSNVLKKFGNKPIALCCDHSGFRLKEIMKIHLNLNNISVIDFGTYTNIDCDHYDFLFPAVKHINDGFCDFGMGFCRTGQAFNIAANKQKGIRSALVSDIKTAEYAVRHNCANFFCMSEDGMKEEMLDDIINILRHSTFDGGRHANRIMKIEGE